MNHSAWKLVKSFYCLDTDTSIDRWEGCIPEFLKVGINFVERRIGTEGENRYLSFNHAHYKAIEKGHKTGEPFCVFENDVAFDDKWKYIEEGCNQLPEDWDLLYLGANIIGSDTMVWEMPTRYSQNLFRLHNSWMTHAIIYSNKMAKWVLDNFNPDTFPVYDEWLRVTAMPERNVFLLYPMVAYQRKGWSVLTRQQADYSSCSVQGNDYLKRVV